MERRKRRDGLAPHIRSDRAGPEPLSSDLGLYRWQHGALFLVLALARSVLAYLSSDRPRRAGHNPLGAYSVIAMILLLLVQVGTGLFAVDVDGIKSGYLSHLISFNQGRLVAEIHEISFNLLLAMAGLHILAILFYIILRKRNLVGPMVTGRDRQVETTDGALVPAGAVKFLVAAVVAAGVAWWASMGFGI